MTDPLPQSRFGIFGDVSGNLEALEAVLEDCQVQGVTQMVCLGDVIGEYANPRECLEIVRACGCPFVRGEKDDKGVFDSTGQEGDYFTKEDGRLERKPFNPEQTQFVRNLPLIRKVSNFTIVHASLQKPGSWPYILSASEAETSMQVQETQLCFFSHTGVPHVYIRNTEVHQFFYKKIDLKPDLKYFINVGSVGQSRDGNWRADYSIYDQNAGTVELRRLPFDIQKARAKLGLC